MQKTALALNPFKGIKLLDLARHTMLGKRVVLAGAKNYKGNVGVVKPGETLVVPAWQSFLHPKTHAPKEFAKVLHRDEFLTGTKAFSLSGKAKLLGGRLAAGVAVPSAAAGAAAPWILKGSDKDEPVETVEGGTPASKLSPSVMAGGAAAGALAGGLGSLLYGKLKKEPNLRRDVVMALVGAAAGTAAGAMVKTGHQIEFEHDFPGYLEKQAWAWMPILAGAAMLGGTGLQAMDYAKNRGSQKRQVETMARTEEMQQQLTDAHQQVLGGQKALQGAGAGALGGAAGMGLGSAAYGKLTGKENIRRDLVLALLGAVSGGAIGSYAGSRQQA